MQLLINNKYDNRLYLIENNKSFCQSVSTCTSFPFLYGHRGKEGRAFISLLCPRICTLTNEEHLPGGYTGFGGAGHTVAVSALKRNAAQRQPAIRGWNGRRKWAGSGCELFQKVLHLYNILLGETMEKGLHIPKAVEQQDATSITVRRIFGAVPLTLLYEEIIIHQLLRKERQEQESNLVYLTPAGESVD